MTRWCFCSYLNHQPSIFRYKSLRSPDGLFSYQSFSILHIFLFYIHRLQNVIFLRNFCVDVLFSNQYLNSNPYCSTLSYSLINLLVSQVCSDKPLELFQTSGQTFLGAHSEQLRNFVDNSESVPLNIQNCSTLRSFPGKALQVSGSSDFYEICSNFFLYWFEIWLIWYLISKSISY